jgi:hypothetical protein
LYLVQADQDDGPNSQVAKVRLINRAISIWK